MDLYGGVLGADAERAERALAAFRGIDLPGGLALPDVAEGLVDRLVDAEIAAVEAEGNPTPDVVGATDRLGRLAAVARVLDRKEAARRATEASSAWEKERAAQRDVELGLIKGRSVQVLKGLAAGDRLIVAGQRYVGAGQPVNILEER